MLARDSLCPRNLFDVTRRLLLIAGPADCGEALLVIRISIFSSQGEGRAVIEDEEPHDEARAAIGAASILPKDNLGLEPAR
jgi:hypothetical protein